MKNNKNLILTGVLLVIAIIAGLALFMGKENEIENAPSSITFPTSRETLYAGKTYTLRWDDSDIFSSTTSVFLIDSSLLNQGSSVSIIDRVYNIPNIGLYDYMVPTAVADGTYFFVIGSSTSNWFKVSSKSVE